VASFNRQLNEARTDLRRTASITASTLSESRRAADPFAASDGFTLSARMEIPTNQESVGPYLKRISQIPFDLDQEADPITTVHPLYLFRKHFDRRSKYFPNFSETSESDLAVRASFGTIVFEFRKSSRRNSNHLLQLTGLCDEAVLYYTPESEHRAENYLSVAKQPNSPGPISMEDSVVI